MDKRDTAEKKSTGLIFLWLSLLIFISDLLSKWWIVKHFALYQSVEVLPIFNLTYVRNYGAAFSFLAEHNGWQKYFFILLAMFISGLLTYWLSKSPRSAKLLNCGYACIIGGALANMLDRLYNGFVIDFLDFHWKIYHYPIFNLADVAICVGAGCLILDHFLHHKRESN
ncbi:signal peptidase II [Mergibacter septicus]|uniref:Lipoprotein signal peptidase n=1 Tax=Mergibacter septicus TaxID=221402 RepID=A0A8D4J0I5_9PAST|nr:signal peptidase II [Mergibacter septicus]AWX15677.1 signal peptidase II [Mergibacter septicus]QDJ13154.1 signal peptidase II [Mergibacter septicus]QDJ14930.1 signal peptidase II [Mergibacter septicus]UTU47643.1 signal peptidase II [Mergibacter septicus]WMR96751.1 signal peptidase II [Mergibacter septicus]